MTDPVDIALQHCRLPFDGELHGYQQDDINRACVDENFLFALDLGLGKTVCSALTAVYKIASGEFDCCIVLCPATLVTQWHSTILKMGLEATAYAGPPAQRKKKKLDVDFIIMSFEIFRGDYDYLKDLNAYFIVDECTILCQQNNLLYKLLQGGTVTKTKTVPGSIKPVIEKKVYKKINRGCALLSGTPINAPLDAYALIKVLNKDIYRNITQFKRLHILKEDYFGNAVEYQNLDLLKENLMLSATLRHTTDHIDLPPITYKTVTYTLSPKHLKLYNKLLTEKLIEIGNKVVIDGLQVNSLFHWAQRIILRPDLAGLDELPKGIEILDGLLKSVPQFILFSNYVESNSMLVDRYNAGGIYGKTTPAQKKKSIEDFKAGKLKGMAVNPRSGGYGLDIPECQFEFFPEMPITPRDFRQCVGRIHRQGQEGRCVVTVLVAEGTIQATLIKRLLVKDDIMNQVVDSPKSLRRDLLSDVVEDQGPKTRAQLIKDLRGEV